VAGANFALGWVQKWHPRLNFVTMSLGLPSSQRFRTVALQIHMDATLQPAQRMIARLLEADASFFREYHYLNPLRVDPSDQVELYSKIVICFCSGFASVTVVTVLMLLPESCTQDVVLLFVRFVHNFYNLLPVFVFVESLIDL
jgi:hypothetical protein